MLKRWAVIALHLGYWLLYLLLIVTFIQATSHGRGPHNFQQVMNLLLLSPTAIATVFPGVISFYGFYLVLFTRFLERRRFLQLVIAAFLLLVTTVLFTLLLLAVRMHPSYSARMHNGVELGAMMTALFLVALVHGVIGLVMRGFVAWYGDISIKERLRKRNFEIELALVKSQLNPHFLFNTLNNIDVLIEKDPSRASAYLNKLSDIMRFMLYETKTSRIPLSKELTYIDKYIDLQKIRAVNPDYVSYIVEGDPSNLMIEPMLFIPFIENAFKHAEDKRREHAIRIHFRIGMDSIEFDCINRYSQNMPETTGYSGLGNDLIRRRLALLYPGTHELTIDAGDQLFTAKLVLNGNLS